jgi:hypothetical protein
MHRVRVTIAKRSFLTIFVVEHSRVIGQIAMHWLSEKIESLSVHPVFSRTEKGGRFNSLATI